MLARLEAGQPCTVRLACRVRLPAGCYRVDTPAAALVDILPLSGHEL
jgi:hypothetical protein